VIEGERVFGEALIEDREGFGGAGHGGGKNRSKPPMEVGATPAGLLNDLALGSWGSMR